MAKSKEKEHDKPAYRALVGLNFRYGDEQEKRVEAGDKITDMPENAVRHELAAGNIEEWEPRQLENVRSPEDDDVVVEGVTSRHSGDNIVVRDVSN